MSRWVESGWYPACLQGFYRRYKGAYRSSLIAGKRQMRILRKPCRNRPTRSISCALAWFISYGALLMSCGGGSFQPRQLIALSVQPSDADAVPGGTVPFSATGTFDSAPMTQPNVPAQWSSSDQNVATIDPNTGIATCVAAGGPIGITATAAGKGGMLHSAANLTCTASPPPLTGHCAVNGTVLTGACWINSCSTVVDSAHCPAGQPPVAAKTVVRICIPGPPILTTIDEGRSCGP